MAKKKKIVVPHKHNEEVENYLASMVSEELETSKRNQSAEMGDFESLIDIVECKRTEKDYDWMSDVFIPELPSILLTDASTWANQYFQSRDFVDVKLEGSNPNDLLICKAVKKLINNTLNRRDLYHYHKYIRAKMINFMKGHVYIICWWEQETKQVKVGESVNRIPLNVDIYGEEFLDPTTQQRAFKEKKEDVYREKIIKDHFNYEVLDPRNVFTDDKYCYSIQEKDWVIVRWEKSYEELKADEKKNKYFNLNVVKELIDNPIETDTAKDSYRKGTNTSPVSGTPVKRFDVYDRFGKMYAIIEERDGEENPIKIKPGVDSSGNVLDNAELVSGIMTFAIIGSSKILVRFEPTPNIDSRGRPYYPLVRGWCYIHPTKDTGLSDGKYGKEIQSAINDNFNMGADRVKLATLPVFKGRKLSLQDNSSVYMEPEHVIELEDPNDLVELKISDDITGTLNIQATLKAIMEQTLSTYPTTMGALPEHSSTTATAIAGAETRTNARSNYKSLTFEYTFFMEFYNLILQMTYMFARPQTLMMLMGEDAYNFSPDNDYTYTPVSSNIEMEYNKYKKIQLFDQTIGRLSGLVQQLPALVPIIAHMIQRQLELQGDEYQVVGKMIENLSKSKPQGKEGEQGGQGVEQPKDMEETPTSNQTGNPQSTQEEMTRSMTGGMI